MKILFLNIEQGKIDLSCYHKTSHILIDSSDLNYLLEILEEDINILCFKDIYTFKSILSLNTKIFKDYKYFLLSDLINKSNLKNINLDNEDSIFCMTLFNYISNLGYTIKDLSLKTIDFNNFEFNYKVNDFKGKNILVTGKVTGFTRGEIFQKIRWINANPCIRYSDNIDILVKGSIKHKTNKFSLVENAKKNGKKILVIDGEEFKKIICQNTVGVDCFE